MASALLATADFYGYVWQGNAYEGLTCDAHEWLVSETGNSFIDPDGTVNVNNQQFVDFLNRAQGWVGGISPEAVTTYQEEESRAVWQAGNAAFMRNWPYAYGLGNADDSVIKGKFGYAPLPTGDVRARGLPRWLAARRSPSTPRTWMQPFRSLSSWLRRPSRKSALSARRARTRPSRRCTMIPTLRRTRCSTAMKVILPTAFARPSGVTADALQSRFRILLHRRP